MKRVLICAAASTALLVPGSALGGTISQSVYFGELDGVEGSEVKLKARTGDHGTRVIAVAVRDVPVNCEGDEEFVLPRVVLRGKIPVEGHKFSAEDDNGKTTFKVEGRVGERKATGRFRYFGEMDAGDQTLECDTGRQSFTARV